MKEHYRGPLPALVFGQGRVRTVDTIKKIEMGDMPSSNGSLNWWASEIVGAGRVLAERGMTQEFKIMGGKTGGAELDSEAELIGGGIEYPFQGQVKNFSIDIEIGSTNTLENLVNICNDVLDQPGEEEAVVDLFGASFHLTRMKILAKLFDIKYRHVIGADSVMLFAAEEKGDGATIVDIGQRHDGNAAGRVSLNATEAQMDAEAKKRGHDVGYYAARDDIDEKTILQKRQEEDLWTRALLTIPAYSLIYFSRIKSDDRLMRVMRNFDTNFFPTTEKEPSALSAYDINLETDSPDAIRAKLAKITRDLPDEEKRAIWIQENATKVWDIEEKFQHILAS